MPVRAAVERRPHAALRARVQQRRVLRIFAHAAHELIRREIRRQRTPCRAEVVGGEDVRPVVAAHVVIDGDERGPRRRMSRLDRVHAAPFRHRRRRHVLPRCAAVARELHEPVVGTDPDRTARELRRRDLQDRVAVLRARHVFVDRSARRLLVRLLVARQVGADHRPVQPAVGAAEENVSADERGAVGGKRERRVPVEAMGQRREFVLRGARVGRHLARLLRAHVVDVHLAGIAVRRRGPHEVRIAGIEQRPHAVAGTGGIPVAVEHADAVVAGRRPAPRAVVLQPDTHRVRRHHAVESDVVRLRDRQRVRLRPVPRAVGGEHHAFVARHGEPPSVGGEPHVVIVPARVRRDRFERARAVGAQRKDERHADDAVAVRRVDVQPAEIERPRADESIVRHGAPCVAAVVRAPNVTVLRLDDRVHATARRGRHADAAGDPVRQPVSGQLAPRRAAVVGTVEPAVRAAAAHRPRLPPELPQAREQRRRTVGHAREIGRTARRAGVQRARPVRAAVVRDEHATRRAVAKHVPQHADDHGARIARIERDRGDRARVVEARVAPGLAAVRGMPHARAFLDGVARVGFAGADPHVVRIARRHRERADRRDGLAIEHRTPRHAAVGALEDAAARTARVIHHGIAVAAGDCGGAAAGDRRPDRTVRQRAEAIGRCVGARAERRRQRERARDDTEAQHERSLDHASRLRARSREALTPAAPTAPSVRRRSPSRRRSRTPTRR